MSNTRGMDMREIIEKAGGPSKLAKAVGRHHATILGWRRVPAEHVPAVSRHTGVARYVIRPDIYEAPADQVAA